MKAKFCCSLAAGLIATFSIYADDAKPLPGAVDETLKKLAAWETEQVEAVRAAIEAKRVQVIALLQRELDSTTRKGDLESAVKIQGEIDRLSAEKVTLTLSTPVRPAGDGWTAESLTGTIWNLKDESKLTLHHGGVLEMLSNDGRMLVKDTWYLRKDGVLEFRWDGRPTHKETVVLNPDGRTGIYGRSDEVNIRLIGRNR